MSSTSVDAQLLLCTFGPLVRTHCSFHVLKVMKLKFGLTKETAVEQTAYSSFLNNCCGAFGAEVIFTVDNPTY